MQPSTGRASRSSWYPPPPKTPRHCAGTRRSAVRHPPSPHLHRRRACTILLQLDDDGDGDDERPWWRRPPRVWPPRVDDPSLVFGDVAASYAAAYLALDVLTTGRAPEWQAEGSALASAWLIAAAVTNAWDPTAVLPSLGLRNALACVARTSVDLASTLLVLALAGAVLAQRAVDVKLLVLELLLEVAAVGAWRTYYTSTSTDTR